MCNPVQGFKLCTCKTEPVVHNKSSKRYKKHAQPATYTWHLLRYAGTANTEILGLAILPSTDIGDGLTSSYVVEKLNSENCFDFDYAPVEKDCLTIRFGDKWDNDYLAFSFMDGKWVEGKNYDVFNDIMTDLGKGKLKPMDDDKHSGNFQ